MQQQRDVTAKSTNINLRVAPTQRDLIDRAAQSVGKTRTEFILDVATREAEQTLLDQHLFFLQDEVRDAFIAALDAPVRASKKLRKLLTTDASWD
jgi:uncharacterized protein (DUF1778 family)